MFNLYLVLLEASGKTPKSVKGVAQADYKKGNSYGRAKKNKTRADAGKRSNGIKGVKRLEGTLKAAGNYYNKRVTSKADERGREDGVLETVDHIDEPRARKLITAIRKKGDKMWHDRRKENGGTYANPVGEPALSYIRKSEGTIKKIESHYLGKKPVKLTRPGSKKKN